MYDFNEHYTYSDWLYYWDGSGEGYYWRGERFIYNIFDGDGIGNGYYSKIYNKNIDWGNGGNGRGETRWSQFVILDSELLLWHMTRAEYVLQGLR